jgi:AraC family transcriptional regulator, transcriptional activator of pobA
MTSFKAEYYCLSDQSRYFPLGRKDFYKIWLINNEGLLHHGDQKTPIIKPALVFLNPQVSYVFEPMSVARTGYWCVFPEAFLRMESPLFKPGAENIFFPDNKQLTVINFLFEQIIEDFNSEYAFKYESIRNHVDLLIHAGMKMRPVLSGNLYNNAATRIAALFLNLLKKQYPIDNPQQSVKLKKPSDFANTLAMHVNHLNAVIQEVTGKSTSTHIAESIINEGKALLLHSSWSIAEIAYCLGFEYPNHFSNFFKKHTGITPLSLRK